MRAELVWSRRSQQDLRQLDRQVAESVVAAVVRLTEQGQGDVTRLAGSDELRLRVGDWRVRFVVHTAPDAARTLEVLRVLPRGRAYRDG